MSKFPVFVALTFIASIANAQSRDAWIRECQAEGPDLSNSNGYRVCTELYVMELEKRQSNLVAQVGAKLAREAERQGEAPLAQEHFFKSQELWRSFVGDHCQVEQALFSDDSPVGDAIPACTAEALEQRNEQLERLLRRKHQR